MSSTASLLPATTTCPGELKLTGSTTPSPLKFKQILMTSSSDKPKIAAIPPVPEGTASCINSALFLTNLIASENSIESAATSAEYSPKLCPENDSGCRSISPFTTLKVAYPAANIAGWVLIV